VKTCEHRPGHTAGMNTTVTNTIRAVALITLGLAVAAMGFYVAEADDAPGAAAMGLVVMGLGIVLGLRAARNRLPTWAARTALGVGILAVMFAALLTRGVMAVAPLFPQSGTLPSVAAPGLAAEYSPAADQARTVVRAAMLEHNLPGISVAVGVDDSVVWAEGFGWRDVTTETPVTPATRFNIGTAASTIAPSVASLGLTNTGTDEASSWSPEAIGEEGEDFPPLALLRHLIWQPLGLMASDYPLAGDRATFYVPRFEDNNTRRGRRLMYMRDLACCVDGMTFYSTPSDLVRVGLAGRAGTVEGKLAGGSVVSLLTNASSGMVVAVTSNIAYADTGSIASRVQSAFTAQRRP
jgi:hypothetical protein